jgi:hypothetical protein
MRLLVVSPIPTHPRNQGNAARIHALCRSLQLLGYRVHFLYHPLEGLSAVQREQMTACWDGFHALPGVRPIPATADAGHALDDWYDPALGTFARRLQAQWRFDAVLVNYVWMSGVLEQLPDMLPKIIDTHDVFGDRQRAFRQLGLAPEWYHTTPAEERRGLLRADLLIAIQPDEGRHFREVLGADGPEVMVVGHATPRRFLPPRAPSGRCVVGYLGSGNPFNVAAVQGLARLLAAEPALCEGFRFLLGGTVCSALPRVPAPFEAVGLVDDVEDFYARIDLSINPMQGGTGLKIKTLEGLSFGLPVLGTPDAWIGIGEPAALLPEAASTGMVDGLRALAADETLLPQLRTRCRAVFGSYLAEQLAATRALATRIEQLATVRHAAAGAGL